MVVILRQQPMHGRKIGFTAFQSYLSPELILEYSGSESSVCVVSLHTDEYIIRNGVVFETLVGTRVQAPKPLFDPVDGHQKLFFVFSDLSIRVQGEFIINCYIVDLESNKNTTISTKPIIIVTPQEYPGIQEPTILSKSFSLQGVKTSGRRYQKRLQK